MVVIVFWGFFHVVSDELEIKINKKIHPRGTQIGCVNNQHLWLSSISSIDILRFWHKENSEAISKFVIHHQGK